jgi:hypothetical protein
LAFKVAFVQNLRNRDRSYITNGSVSLKAFTIVVVQWTVPLHSNGLLLALFSVECCHLTDYLDLAKQVYLSIWDPSGDGISARVLHSTSQARRDLLAV